MLLSRISEFGIVNGFANRRHLLSGLLRTAGFLWKNRSGSGNNRALRRSVVIHQREWQVRRRIASQRVCTGPNRNRRAVSCGQTSSSIRSAIGVATKLIVILSRTSQSRSCSA